ncbi:iron-sulfur cluster assembly accessory protein [Bacillaceae bacterium]
MISLTEQASLKIKELMEAEDAKPMYLRIGVRPGGCSGFSYGMGFDDEKQADDKEFEIHGVKILVDPASARYLEGAEIDYKESMMGGGFTINNPNAVATCGCGHSFRTADDPGKPEEC